MVHDNRNILPRRICCDVFDHWSIEYTIICAVGIARREQEGDEQRVCSRQRGVGEIASYPASPLFLMLADSAG